MIGGFLRNHEQLYTMKIKTMKIKPSPKLNYENKPETIYYED